MLTGLGNSAILLQEAAQGRKRPLRKTLSQRLAFSASCRLFHKAE